MFLSFFRKNKKQPLPWYKTSVVYQIYPSSFQDSNGDGVGDIRGIINRLPYLQDGTENSLGIGAVWLCPIYTSPMKDFGYDIADFYNIDSRFGTLKDFDELVLGLHKRNIKIIMDLVINHTSSKHPWFKESRSSKTNWKRDWYIWRDPKPDGSPPNNWVSVFGGPAWTIDPETNQYYLHQFLPDQPDLNWRNEYVIYEMQNILQFWLERGVDGFRVDAFGHLLEDGLFRDDVVIKDQKNNIDDYASYMHNYSTNRPELTRVIDVLTSTAKQKPDTFIVFETYLDLHQLVNMYNLHESKQYAPFNFNFISMPWNAVEYRKFVDDFDKLLQNHTPTYVFGNHDRPRLISRLDEKRARVCAMLLLTLRGMPFIYYGEEIGMEDVTIEKKDIRDGFALTSLLPGVSRDPARTPMQWNTEKNAGFSTYTPWLPVASNYEEMNIEVEEKNPQSMLSLYKSLIHYRNNSRILQEGSYQSIETGSPDIFGYIRTLRGEKKRILVLLNFKDGEIKISIPHLGKIIFSTTGDVARNTIFSKETTMCPYEGIVVEI